MQFYNKLKHKFQPSRASSQSPTQDLGLSQHKPPTVDSRSQWNTNVYMVPKWERKAIQRVDSQLQTPFPTRKYINYVELHSGGFKQELNLDFFKHIFRHFALNQWWIEEARKFKASIPINILQSPEAIYQNPDYRRLVLQKNSDDLKFYKEILANIQSPPQPQQSKQLPEYRKSITYQILDLHAGQEHKDKSLFQLQDVFVNRIIQLISNNGLKILGYYDYQTFKNIVQDRIRGHGDAENFAKILEIKRLFNSVDRIQRECEQNVQEWQRQDTLASNKTKTKFRRWQQEKTLFSEEMLELAGQVGLKINLVKARKLYEMNQTEQNFKELVNIGDQIQLSTHKTLIDTLSKIAQDELNNFSSSNNLIEEDALQIARIQYEEQKKIIDLDQSQITKQIESHQKSSRNCSDLFQQNENEKLDLEFDEQRFLNIQQENDLPKNLDYLYDDAESNTDKEKPFKQYKQIQQYQSQIQDQQVVTKQYLEEKIGIASKNNSRSGNTSNQNKSSRNKIQSSDHDRLIHSQWSQKSFKPFEDLIRPNDSMNNFQDIPKRNSVDYYQQLDYQDPSQNNQLSSRKLSQNLSQIQKHNPKFHSETSNSVSQHAKNTNNSIQDDIKLLSEFVQQNREEQEKLKQKIFQKEKEKETAELQQLQQQLEIIQKDEKGELDIKSRRDGRNKKENVGVVNSKIKKTIQSEERIIENKISQNKIPNQGNTQKQIDNNFNEPNENIVKLDCGYNVPSIIPGSNSNNTTARTSRNTSNYNSVQVKKSKVENVEETTEELPQPQKIIQEDLQSQDDVQQEVTKEPIQRVSRQTSIKAVIKNQERKTEKPDSRSQNKDSKHDRQLQIKTREGSIQTSQFKEQNYNIETKQDESNNYLNSQQSSENSPHRTKNTSKSQEKSTRFQKSVTKIIDKNKQQKKQETDIEESVQDKHQEKRKSRHKTGNRDQIEESYNDDQEDDEEKQNNLRIKRQKSMKRGQFQSVSMPKIGRDDETRRYLLNLKEELREMLEKQVNLKDIKEKINIIMSEIAGVKLDPELEYYLQLYKTRVQELSQVNQQSKEIYFQSIQPVVELNLRKEIKGLKFARNCDRIPKLQPQDLEDIFVLQQMTQREFESAETESQAQSYQPTFRYEQKPLPIQSDLIQVSLDVVRKKTPNTQRYERTGSLLDRELPKVIVDRKKTKLESKKQIRSKHLKPFMIKRDKLSEDFPYLNKYKPELLKSILEARISLEQLV